MKKTMVALCGVMAMTMTAVEAKEWTKVRIAVDVPYEPFEYRLPSGELTGFEVDLGNAVCEQAKLDCEWVVQGWDGIIPGLLARKYDMIFSSMSITEERAKRVLFSAPYYNTPTGFFTPAGSEIDVTNPETLKGLRVGAQRGTIQDDYATENYGDVATVRRYATGDELVLDLKGGRLDLVVLDYPVGVSTILEADGGDKYMAVGDTVQLGNGVGAAFRPRDTDLKEIIEAALEEVKANGTYDEINAKYFDYSIKL